MAYPSEGITTRADREKHVERFKKSLVDADWTPYGVFREGRMVGVFRNSDTSYLDWLDRLFAYHRRPVGVRGF